MEYQSIARMLDGLWDCHWDALSYEQQRAWQKKKLQFGWDELAPGHRQQVAWQYDQQHNPANEEENSFWFNNACAISDVEREISEIELLPTPLPSERAEKNRQLEDARQRLVDLKSAQFKQSTAPALVESTKEKKNATIWQDHARAIADELDLADCPKAYDSVTHIADRIAPIMRNKGIYGPRGPLSAGTILREALSGGKWKRKR